MNLVGSGFTNNMMCPDSQSAALAQTSEYFRTFSGCHENLRESRNCAQAYVCTAISFLFIYLLSESFQTDVEIFNWVEVTSFVSRGFTKQHGVS